MITVDQALSILLDQVQTLGPESVAIEQAHRRILVEDVRADMDLPPFDRARMDGYAVRSSDVSTSPVKLRVIGEIAAGVQVEHRINAGEAVKIFTGAPVPGGADAVQKVEVTRANGHIVEILEPVTPGQFITLHASEVAAGEVVGEKGREIGPAEMAGFSSFWYVRGRGGGGAPGAGIFTGGGAGGGGA